MLSTKNDGSFSSQKILFVEIYLLCQTVCRDEIQEGPKLKLLNRYMMNCQIKTAMQIMGNGIKGLISCKISIWSRDSPDHKQILGKR